MCCAQLWAKDRKNKRELSDVIRKKYICSLKIQMRKLLFPTILFCILLISSLVSAQTKYEDVLYLKNGSILRGLIIEQVPNESLKIQTKDRNVFVFRMDEVLKIAKEEVVSAHRKREPLTKDNIKVRGFTNITELSLGRDVLDNGADAAVAGYSTTEVMPSLGIQTVNGYMFNHYIIAGIGIAFNTNSELAFVPLFAELRINLSDAPVAGFVFIDGGYSFTAKEIYALGNDRKYFGGTYFSPGLGIKLNVAKTKALSFSIGYRNQQARIYVTDYGTYPDYITTGKWNNYDIGYINTKVGFIF